VAGGWEQGGDEKGGGSISHAKGGERYNVTAQGANVKDEEGHARRDAETPTAGRKVETIVRFGL